MEYNAKNICRTMITGEGQKLNKQMVEFKNFHTFSILYARFGQTLFQGLENRFYNSILFQYRVGTLN